MFLLPPAHCPRFAHCIQRASPPPHLCGWDVRAGPAPPPARPYWPGDEVIPCLESLPILPFGPVPDVFTWHTVLITLLPDTSSVVPTLWSPLFQGLGQSALPRATCHPILSCPEYFLHIPTLISLPSESPGGLVKRTVSQALPQGALANTLGAGIRHFTFKTLVPVTLWVSQAWGLSPLSCPTIPESWHARSHYRSSTCSAST